MIRREWNALRVGEYVLVHDDDDPTSPLVPGRVTRVDPAAGSNSLTIRLSPPGEPARVVQPRRLVVHLDSGEARERCWRCEVRHTTTPTGRTPRTKDEP
jgi:hypothetical protein